MLCCAYSGGVKFFIDSPRELMVSELAPTPVSVLGNRLAPSVPSQATASGGYVHRKPAVRERDDSEAATMFYIRRDSWQGMRTRALESNHRRRTCWFKRRRRQVHVW